MDEGEKRQAGREGALVAKCDSVQKRDDEEDDNNAGSEKRDVCSICTAEGGESEEEEVGE